MAKKKQKTSEEGEIVEGTVIRSTGSWYKVRLESGKVIDARLRGKFRLKGLKSTNPIAVGDQVRLNLIEEEGTIRELLERRNYILRKAVNLSKRVHILVANVDQALVIFSLKEPVTTLGYVDRLLVSCEAYDVKPVILFNKVDLLETEEERRRLEDFERIYRQVGYQTIRYSAEDEQYSEVIRDLFKDKTSFVVGRSGAGKSSTINLAAPELNLKTGSISDFSGRGRHTTTFAEMFPLPFGGYIIDSPGFKELQIYNIKAPELSHFFPEMAAVLHDCKFNNCLHLHEPGCAVRPAVESGEIPVSRYNTYQSMIQEIEAEEETYS